MTEIVYLNGKFIPAAEAKISPFDHGFLYGYGLFETMRSYNGIIFLLEKHLARLRKGAELLGINSELASRDLKQACSNILPKNRLADARIRLTVSAGEGDIVPNPKTCTAITVFIVARKLIPPSPEQYEKGYQAVIASVRRNSQSPLSSMKTSCYLENALVKQAATKAGADEAIVLNEKGLITEGSATTIFLVKNSMLYTPSPECGALPGITRETVLELAHQLPVKTLETEITPEQLYQADEVFLTNSLIELMPLTRIGDKPVGSGKAGEITTRLIALYKELVTHYSYS